MTKSKQDRENNSVSAYIYEIKLGGHLNTDWQTWFEDMHICLNENGETLLVGVVTDQAALHGLLKKIRDMGMPLLSLKRCK
ncbi:MAG: hypothetical protein OEZ58_04460 [Gammaproteobacteria bacterium]|nr:hypothetical protein [Gammaproteobacteria bacterium]MDH5728217.1 hypothetical protein [Gammaproteobacteria bacterium]